MQQIGLDAVLNNVPDFTAGINKMNQGVDSFAQNSKAQGEGFAGGFGEIVTGALRQIGTLAVDAMLKAGRAVAGFVKDSIGLAGDFQANMLEFQSVAGKDVDTKGLEQFRDLFIDIGKRLPVSTSEVQQAAIEMVKGGIDPATIAAGGLEQNIKFAAAAMDGDLVKAAEISSKILGGWTATNATAAERADFLTHSTDLLAKAANASSTDVEGLSRGIFQAQGIAKTAGVSFDDLTTTLAELAPRFGTSAEAGTSLKNLIARLQPTTDPATEAMAKLGLYSEKTGSAFYDAQGNFVGFHQASQLLQNSLKGLTKEQQASALQTIFGNDAMSSAAALAELGAQGYDAMAQSLANANGVQEAAALKQQGFNTALDNAKGSVEALQITIGTTFLPILTDLLNNYIAPGINNVTAFADSFSKMIPAIQASDDPIQTFLNALKVAAPSLLDFISSIEDIKDAVTPAVEEIMRLADAFSEGGLSGLIDAVVSDIEAALPDIEAALLKWGQAFVDWIAPMIPPALNALGELATQAWAWVQEQAPEWAKQLQAWGEEFVAWIAPMIPPALAELGKLGQAFLDWIGEQAQPLLKKFNDWAASFVEWIPGATVDFLKEWPKMFDQFLDWIGSEAGPLLKKLGDWALSFIEWIAPMIPPFLVALGGVALAIGTWIIETAAVLSKKIVEVWVPAILTWIVTDAIPGLVKALDSFLKVFDGWIKDAQASLARKMIEVGAAIVNGIQTGISDAWGGFTTWIHDQMMLIPEAVRIALGISSPSKVMADLVGTPIIQGIMQGMQTATPGMLQNVAMIGTQITTQFEDTDLVDGLTSLGEDVMAGFGAGIKTGLRSIKTLINSTADTVEGAFQDAFGAHSPATRMMPIGASITQGIVSGIQGALPLLNNVADQVGATLASHVKMMTTSVTEAIEKTVQDIKDQVSAAQDAIANLQIDTLNATANIDRQKVKNLKDLADISKTQQGGVQEMLDAAQQQAQQMTDPAQAAAFFKQRSAQIFELAKLNDDILQATTEGDSARREALIQQYNLINAAQNAETQALQQQQAQSSATMDVIKMLQELLHNQNLPGILESPVINQLNTLLGQLVSPPSTQPITGGGATTTNTNTTNLNMPIYTNNSPGAMQQSMAVAMAGLI